VTNALQLLKFTEKSTEIKYIKYDHGSSTFSPDVKYRKRATEKDGSRVDRSMDIGRLE